ncbi:exodeoxyribonuclease VII large subunit [Methanoplanus endosymbiosus]|uniref:Exodeoxyribonuclease VII large subunit n=1 Tax=Methanoplanus endosymbiosus TaxID=33865 RepID=A0A9E7PNX2_9EURY|nr:exodeoxyribonuclease VII large subunit [Methanoplanus endosymbiosus]UUX92777.1 exodeoxyribonuclease VII large subunit [Methanoplanus endosymbiosus]
MNNRNNNRQISDYWQDDDRKRSRDSYSENNVIRDENDSDEDKVKKVSEISTLIKKLLDNEQLCSIWMEGEITNLRAHASGHLYYSLIEVRNNRTYTINCVMWRSAASELPFQPENGVLVRVFGSVDVYEPHGKYQFVSKIMQTSGTGDKHRLVLRWKEELSKEGLFSEQRKKTLPRFPLKVGLVTSSGGAARRDIENVIRRRFPVEIVLFHAAVQGENAHNEIARALSSIDDLVDVIIVGRGGGSFEDLFSFNHPDVVRAIGRCETPVVSAIGHEIDYTLADFAADLRAPTPSAAAELVVPDMAELRKELGYFRSLLKNSLFSRLERESEKLENIKFNFHPERLERRLNFENERTDELSVRLNRRIESALKNRNILLESLNSRLLSSNPKNPMKNGFCLIESGGILYSSVHDLSPGEMVKINFKDGSADAKIEVIYNEKKL